MEEVFLDKKKFVKTELGWIDQQTKEVATSDYQILLNKIAASGGSSTKVPLPKSNLSSKNNTETPLDKKLLLLTKSIEKLTKSVDAMQKNIKPNIKTPNVVPTTDNEDNDAPAESVPQKENPSFLGKVGKEYASASTNILRGAVEAGFPILKPLFSALEKSKASKAESEQVSPIKKYMAQTNNPDIEKEFASQKFEPDSQKITNVNVTDMAESVIKRLADAICECTCKCENKDSFGDKLKEFIQSIVSNIANIGSTIVASIGGIIGGINLFKKSANTIPEIPNKIPNQNPESNVVDLKSKRNANQPAERMPANDNVLHAEEQKIRVGERPSPAYTPKATSESNVVKFPGNSTAEVEKKGLGSIFKHTGSEALKGVEKKGLGSIVKGLGVPLAVALEGLEYATGAKKATKRNLTGSAGGIAGGLAGAEGGALAGAALGSVVPVLGTAIGATIGGFAGGTLGYMGGEKLGTSGFDAAAGIFGKPNASAELTKPKGMTRQVQALASANINNTKAKDAKMVSQNPIINSNSPTNITHINGNSGGSSSDRTVGPRGALDIPSFGSPYAVQAMIA